MQLEWEELWEVVMDLQKGFGLHKETKPGEGRYVPLAGTRGLKRDSTSLQFQEIRYCVGQRKVGLRFFFPCDLTVHPA